MREFGEVVEGFSRFSGLLDANFDAMHGSFSSFVRLMDVFSEFLFVMKSFTIIRLIFAGFSRFSNGVNKLLGRPLSLDNKTNNNNIQNIQRTNSTSHLDINQFHNDQIKRKKYDIICNWIYFNWIFITITYITILEIFKEKIN